MTYSAEQLSLAGDQFLGRGYDEMDCQEFVERCLEVIGCKKDLKGSNAWFREMTWTGTPEECVKVFGCVPKGAFLFIWADDGGEIKRGYHDGKGNASHIGIKTGRGKGAIHSSSSRGCVTESEFNDKTIKHGGWNRVGLWDKMDYTKSVNWMLAHIGIGEKTEKQEGKPMQAVAKSRNGGAINLRKKPGGDLLDRVPSGSTVEIVEIGNDWSRITWNGKTGWMMTEFLEADESSIPGDDDFGPGDLGEQTGDEKVQLVFTVAELAQLLPLLRAMEKQIIDKVGRG